MTVLKDIKFKLSGISGPNQRATIVFPNGFGASILNGVGCSVKDTTYELAVLDGNNLCYDTHITDDVLGWQTEEEINVALKQIAELTPRP